MDPIKEVKAAFPTGRFILGTVFAFIAINFVLDALGNFVPSVGAPVASFIRAPFSFIKSKVSPAPAA